MSATLRVGAKDPFALLSILARRINEEEQLAESAHRLKEKYQHRAVAAGLREALELVEAVNRSVELNGEPANVRPSQEILAWVDARVEAAR